MLDMHQQLFIHCQRVLRRRHFGDPLDHDGWARRRRLRRRRLRPGGGDIAAPRYCQRLQIGPFHRHPCVFRAKLDTHSTANWTRIPRQTGHPVQRKLDTDSAPNWTV